MCKGVKLLKVKSTVALKCLKRLIKENTKVLAVTRVSNAPIHGVPRILGQTPLNSANIVTSTCTRTDSTN